MKFSTVEIRPNRVDEGSWSFSFYDLEGDRDGSYHAPHNLGFYHYPRRMGREKAFQRLKQHLISAHEKEIERLSKSLESLRSLTTDHA